MTEVPVVLLAMGRGLLSVAEAALRVLQPDAVHGQVTTWLFNPSSAGEFVFPVTKATTFTDSDLIRSDPPMIISFLITQNQWTLIPSAKSLHLCHIMQPNQETNRCERQGAGALGAVSQVHLPHLWNQDRVRN